MANSRLGFPSFGSAGILAGLLSDGSLCQRPGKDGRMLLEWTENAAPVDNRAVHARGPDMIAGRAT